MKRPLPAKPRSAPDAKEQALLEIIGESYAALEIYLSGLARMDDAEQMASDDCRESQQAIK